MPNRVNRIDRFTARVVMRPPGSRASARTDANGTMEATRTAEGYLIAEGCFARDGLLTYSDGAEEWIEYRPREELAAGLQSWALVPVTDDHPPRMVDATTWVKVARGLSISVPTLDPPDLAGISYMRGSVLIADAALIEAIESGKQAELSIGFTANVIPTENGTAPDGTRADAIQTGLLGNHIAVVVQGRAGGACRVLLDSASASAYHKEAPMTTPKSRKDEVGAPTDVIEITGPQGEPVTVPTWVAAMLQELQEIKAAQAAAPVADPAAPPAAPAAAPMAAPAAAPVPAPAPEAAPAPAEAAAPAAPGDPEEEEEEDAENKDAKDEEKDEPTMDAAAISTLVRKRARLVRLAGSAGVPAATLDTADDAALARQYVAARMPHMASKLDSLNADQLAALVDAAESLPEPEPRRDAAGIWRAPVVREDAAEASPEDAATVAFLSAAGYPVTPVAQ